MLYQFTSIAYKDKEIYTGDRVNCFTIDVNQRAKVLKLEFNYLLLTTLNSIRYKEPTENMVILPVVKTAPVADPLEET